MRHFLGGNHWEKVMDKAAWIGNSRKYEKPWGYEIVWTTMAKCSRMPNLNNEINQPCGDIQILSNLTLSKWLPEF